MFVSRSGGAFEASPLHTFPSCRTRASHKAFVNRDQRLSSEHRADVVLVPRFQEDFLWRRRVRGNNWLRASWDVAHFLEHGCEALVVCAGAQSGKSVILSGGEYGNVFRARRLTV